jgi:hypothetical protein
MVGRDAAVTTYFDRYRLVLVTNYRDFRLIGEDHAGRSLRDGIHPELLARAGTTNGLPIRCSQPAPQRARAGRSSLPA